MVRAGVEPATHGFSVHFPIESGYHTICRFNKKPPNKIERFLWCEPGLNRRHMDFQSIALPTELSHLDLKLFSLVHIPMGSGYGPFPFGAAKIGVSIEIFQNNIFKYFKKVKKGDKIRLTICLYKTNNYFVVLKREKIAESMNCPL